MIHDVYFWQAPDGKGGMVMVFDEAGFQMPKYQGRIERVRNEILERAGPTCRFWIGQWDTGCNGPYSLREWQEKTR